MALILRFHRGHVDHSPYLTFAMVVTHQHAQQLADVQRIALGPTLATIDLHRGGIYHGVEDPLCLQKPMQPEAFAARFVTTDHRRGVAQTKARFSLGHFVEQAFSVTCRHSAFAWFVTMTNAEAELPGLFTQLEGHKQYRCRCVIRLVTGRCGHHGLSPPW